MPRRRQHAPLRVLLNNRLVGHLTRASGGAISSTAPLYDVLSAQPSLNSRQIARRQMKLAMSVGARRHSRIEEIVGRHFVQTGQEAGLPKTLVNQAIEDMADHAADALEKTARALPADFPASIHESVSAGVLKRVRQLTVRE
ncbi:HipA domain-containing protein [Spiribacter insolitus]|uniref:Uncharacterized protein n=1 Tax=Spiribacter insolitus TaxID=3122417 RepID=A0ABV3T8I4_9GAMM